MHFRNETESKTIVQPDIQHTHTPEEIENMSFIEILAEER